MKPESTAVLRQVYWVTILVCLAATTGLMIYLAGPWDWQPGDFWAAFWLLVYALSPYLGLALAGRWLARHPLQIGLLWLGAALNLVYQSAVMYDVLNNGDSILDRLVVIVLIALPSLQWMVALGAIALALAVALYLRYVAKKADPAGRS
jgi:hypothetical protein